MNPIAKKILLRVAFSIPWVGVVWAAAACMSDGHPQFVKGVGFVAMMYAWCRIVFSPEKWEEKKSE